MNFIFGYGSLICADSRQRTGLAGKALPIDVNGIHRKWSAQVPDWPSTAVSAHAEPDSVCNGVYFEVDDDNLIQFDAREKGYQRILLSWDNVIPLDETALPRNSSLWAYVGHSSAMPSPKRPIMQSYLDVILNGCLDYGVEFADRFTQTTSQWQYLVDDRTLPIYPRPLQDKGRLPHIDRVLTSNLPKLMLKRNS